ncbi:hypothetical protein NPIL_462151 [Nephila pilipes]|uniref:Uncharacterized protein n=1 Tax=Nephila pilipes TaxID=299642 RepID=A0A8X6IRS1_NEPPI|nr:hypothetical protein NPIL_462151 [Nephila pilipes]
MSQDQLSIFSLNPSTNLFGEHLQRAAHLHLFSVKPWPRAGGRGAVKWGNSCLQQTLGVISETWELSHHYDDCCLEFWVCSRHLHISSV